MIDLFNRFYLSSQGLLTSSSQETVEAEEVLSEQILEYARQNFPQEAIITQDGRGFVYLDLPDRYILELFQKVETRGAEIIPYFESEGSVGAHVSIILPREAREKNLLGSLEEVGEEVSFEITGCFSAPPDHWQGVDKVWFLTVSSPRLVEIREKYGLPSQILQHEFHIAFAVERKKDIIISNPQPEIRRSKLSRLEQKV